MFRKKTALFFAFVLVLGATGWSYGQKSVQRSITWVQQTVEKTDQTLLTLESFEGAAFDFRYPNLSLYSETIKTNDLTIQIENQQFQPLNIRLNKEVSDLLNNDIIVEYGRITERKQPALNLKIVPYRKNPSNGMIEKLVSFTIRTSAGSGQAQRLASIPRTYASNSVLKNGNWYKLAIGTPGIYKITYADLEKMGINPASVDPRTLRIYGNGGGILPEWNATPRIDDLAENAIRVIGEEDGTFDRNDYILFYAFGPHNWTANQAGNIFVHETNTYSNYSNYFLATGLGNGKRITSRASSGSASTQTITTFNDYALHELNVSTGVNNTIKSGRERFGEEFNNVLSYDFTFQFPNLVTSSPVKIMAEMIGRSQSPVSSSFTVKANNQLISTLGCFGVPFTYDAAYGALVNTGLQNYTANGDNITISIAYNKPNLTAVGYLNYIELNAIRRLKTTGNQLAFRSISSIGASAVSRFVLETDNPANVEIWDISNKTNPVRQETNNTTSTKEFVLPTPDLKQFVAFSGSDFPSPAFNGTIQNQDLHALGQYDFIILSHPDFVNEAERLANHRRTSNNLRTLVITPDKIYNEFSSGAPDVTAIRDFMKMLYDRAGPNVQEMPKYLLMFGDGSYDNIGVIKQNTNFLPTFESRKSIAPFGSYVSDDYFGLLDDNEGDWDYPDSNSPQAIDVAVGRLPIQLNSKAREMVDKIIQYSNPVTFREWRNNYVFIADDEDNNLHLTHAETQATLIHQLTKKYNIDKIYLDAYPQVSTPVGNRYPEVNNAINQRMNTGALVLNYIGHGGENGLGHEKVVTIDDISSWKNYNNMPVLVTATCSFSRWDDPAFQSAGELSLLNPAGGAIALFTTTRIVYAHENLSINQSFIRALFDSTNAGSVNTLGDIFRQSKNRNGIGLSINNRNFTLLGDPSLPFATPKYNIRTSSVNDIPVNSSNADTLKALSKVTIKGYIADAAGNKQTNFNGIIYPVVFDKINTLKTLGQDAGSQVVSYKVQKNIIYKGKASVTNGEFAYTFVVPKDISYQPGFGRLSYYAQSGPDDANGAYDSIMVGGASNAPITDNRGPEMTVFLNDENFVFGGITGENPVLIVKMKDESGINTVGNGIGHNLTATLINNNKTETIDLNQYYEATLDNYQEGEVKYPLYRLAPGNYKLKVKAWDVFNNSSEISTEFSVIESKSLALEHVLNYPNPFTTSTDFQFEHNRPGDQLQIQVQIFSVSGKLVKTINKEISGAGSRVTNIKWDGRDDFGDKIGRGVYLYRLKVRSSDGTVADKYEKLVLLN